MSLTKLTENLNNVSSLPDAPTLQPEELKAVFDLAGNTIKEYINTVLTIEIEKMITETVNSAKVIVENVLTSTSTTNALSSGQGKALKDLVDTMKTKLDGIAEGATKNVNVATTSINGLMSSADKTKLNGIATGATKNTVENVLTSTSTTNALSSGQGKILKDLVDAMKSKLDGIATGATKNVNVATTSINGLMSSTDKTKLDGIATGATKNVVENVLTSTSTTNALSAGQGKILKQLVDSKQKKISTGTSTPSGGSSGDIYIQTF